jgi:protein-S-isoprenylcysteine O-methyltransferase Ste14
MSTEYPNIPDKGTQSIRLTAKVIIKAVAPSISALVFFGCSLFLSAGTIDYTNAWLYIITVAVMWGWIQLYFAKHDPELFSKRQIAAEKNIWQQFLVPVMAVFLFASHIQAGLDYRYERIEFPFWLSICFALVMIGGFVMNFFVFKQNSFASKTIEIQSQQTVIDTGLYALVRHPMYLSNCIIFMVAPGVLGSWRAFIPMLFLPFLLAIRIRYEEKSLLKGLKGYDEYMKKVRYRLIPWIY